MWQDVAASAARELSTFLSAIGFAIVAFGIHELAVAPPCLQRFHVERVLRLALPAKHAECQVLLTLGACPARYLAVRVRAP